MFLWLHHIFLRYLPVSSSQSSTNILWYVMHIPVSCDLGIFRPLRNTSRKVCQSSTGWSLDVFGCRGLRDLRERLRPNSGIIFRIDWTSCFAARVCKVTGIYKLGHELCLSATSLLLLASAVHSTSGRCSTFSVWEHTRIPLDDFTRSPSEPKSWVQGEQSSQGLFWHMCLQGLITMRQIGRAGTETKFLKKQMELMLKSMLTSSLEHELNLHLTYPLIASRFPLPCHVWGIRSAMIRGHETCQWWEIGAPKPKYGEYQKMKTKLWGSPCGFDWTNFKVE